MSELNFRNKEDDSPKPGIFFRAYGSARNKIYPVWRYHKFKEPIIVKNAEEDKEALENGYKHLDVAVERDSLLFNYMVDLEDFTPRQLSVYIKDEFDLELSPDAGIEKLIQAVWKLTWNHPANENRIVLLAQSIEMNYDETVLEIQKMGAGEKFDETEEEVFYA